MLNMKSVWVRRSITIKAVGNREGLGKIVNIAEYGNLLYSLAKIPVYCVIP